MSRSLRIAILAHSTNPRGGVVHALAVADALVRMGHEAVVHAPDASGRGFFRPSLCPTVSVAASLAGPSLRDLVETRIADYVRHFEEDRERRRFDVFHAQDGISGNALADMKSRGLVGAFARTVHHIDNFADAHVAALQRRAILAADRHFVVSRLWRDVLARDFGIEATLIVNGVDRDFFSSAVDDRDDALRARLALGPGPVFLAIGGIEERKNTLNILRAFIQTLDVRPSAQLVIAGGVSLLDHSAYQRAFHDELARLRDETRRVVLAGAMDQADMPALYRIADTLVFPSVKEGFGLVAIEAIACGTPVIASRIPPFTEHFGDDDVLWCDPFDAATIAGAMIRAIAPESRTRLARRADGILAALAWDRSAAAHLPVYERLREVQHA
jgi:glycosyltransferase-like protein